jgi:hypothetical protein
MSGKKMRDEAFLILFKICFPLKINVICASSHLMCICFHIDGNICVILSSFFSGPLSLFFHSSPSVPPSHSVPYPEYVFLKYGWVVKGVLELSCHTWTRRISVIQAAKFPFQHKLLHSDLKEILPTCFWIFPPGYWVNHVSFLQEGPRTAHTFLIPPGGRC